MNPVLIPLCERAPRTGSLLSWGIPGQVERRYNQRAIEAAHAGRVILARAEQHDSRLCRECRGSPA
jgi:hypothetical protein